MKKHVQSASQMLPIPINVCLNDGIACPVRRKSDGGWGKPNVPVPIDFCTWTVAVPKCTLGAAELKFWIGASLEKQILLAPEFTTPVSW